MLYLHETIDIIGDGQQAYLDSIAERARHSEQTGVSRLVGAWKVIGSTNRWPRVVNLWEMDDWNHWAEALERQFLPEKQDPHLAPWWSAATKWRSGGFDRILEPTSYTPALAALRKQPLKASVCVQTTVRLIPGGSEDYLAAVGTILRPLLEKRGLTLLGAYATPMRSDEALILWAAPDFRALCAHYASRRSDPAIRDWTAHVRPLRHNFETLWLAPSTYCFFHPHHR
jgi:hypothetical protein